MTGQRVDEAHEWLLWAMASGEHWYERAASFADDARVKTLGLAATPESVKEARDFAHTVLSTWDLAGLFDDVRLVVSELVTNALRYAPGLPGATTAPIRLSMLCMDERLTCAVTDPSDRIPVIREPDFVSQTGRGLHLVEAFSDSWNWAPLRGNGKVVWACFAACSAE